mmetsp:Transcript_11348/g.28696  ORF Transcript_11348/g.28696 Transcript_11348/m.28696 type:complete len:205 (+) Transcript_11348:191-805(+)
MCFSCIVIVFLIGSAVMLFQDKHSSSNRIRLDGTQFPNHLLEFLLSVLAGLFLDIENLHQAFHGDASTRQPNLVSHGFQCDEALAVLVHLHHVLCSALCLRLFVVGTCRGRRIGCRQLALGFQSCLFGGLHNLGQVISGRVFLLLVVFGQYFFFVFGLSLVLVGQLRQLLGGDFSPCLGQHEPESRQRGESLGARGLFAVYIVL